MAERTVSNVKVQFLRRRVRTNEKGRPKDTYQLRVSGLMVLRLPRCFAQVRQLAFSSLTPLAIWFFCLVMAFQLLHTSSSVHWWLR